MQRVITLAALAFAVAGIWVGTVGATAGVGVSSVVFRQSAARVDFAVQILTVAPGGTTGWHTHPGPTTVHVVAGAGTLYHANCVGHTFSAGQSFKQPANEVHVFRNEGTVPVTVIASYVLPPGSEVRIDQPAPAGCAVR